MMRTFLAGTGRAALAVVLAGIVPVTPIADARVGGHGDHHAPARTARASAHGRHSASDHRSTHHDRAYPSVKRDAHGRIARDPHAKEAFRRTHPCPSTGKTYGACPGWVVDHVRALKHGGADGPSNMQWQTRAAAKAKDRWE
jgi:hypothetical protein